MLYVLIYTPSTQNSYASPASLALALCAATHAMTVQPDPGVDHCIQRLVKPSVFRTTKTILPNATKSNEVVDLLYLSTSNSI